MLKKILLVTFNSVHKQTHLKILDQMKFNWIKIYNLPNINVLLN